MDEWTDGWNFSPFYMNFYPVTLWVEFANIDACDLVRTSPLSHSRTSPRAERRAAERSGVERSEAERNGAQWS